MNLGAHGSSGRIVLGVAGGIAAYKSCEILRQLTEAGHHVDVIPTRNALRFVGAATFEALSGNPVTADVYDDIPSVRHVKLGQQADLVLIAPATADLIARMASGRADDLLTASLLVARCPVLVAPAMHTEMWEHPATRANVALLRDRGVSFVGPAHGRLTGSDTGPGRLAEPAEISALAQLLLHRPQSLPADLTGLRVVVTAGGTREALDPVRFLTNRSSGKQGWAIARVAAARGADVTLIAANVPAADPAGAHVVRIESALQMQTELDRYSVSADVIVMAAAVSDFRPATYRSSKIKKTDGAPDVLALEKNPDLLATLVARRSSGELGSRPLIVGFAAETGDGQHSILEYGRAKLARKGCDLLLVNSVASGGAFEADTNSGAVLGIDGSQIDIASGPKTAVAAALLDVICAELDRRDRPVR